MAKQYTIPFKSLSGKTCLINIYNSQYTGTAVTLSTENENAPAVPGEKPIYIEESNSDNLMDVIRPKTGYITLVEKSFGALQSLYPETNHQNVVEFYYDGNLVFYGFMQAQAFNNEWGDAPRTLQFPISSPLGMLGTATMPNDATNTERILGEYLDTVLSSFDYVIMPLGIFIANDDEDIVQPLQLRVNGRTVCPWNPDYNFGLQAFGETPSLYAPITQREFLEGFCNLFGLIAHEVGKTVVFSKFGYTGQYIKMDVGSLQDDDYTTTGMPTGDNILTWEDVFSVASTANSESNVMPLGKININYGDYIERVPMDLSRSKAVGHVSLPGFDSSVEVLNKQTNELQSSLYTTQLGTLTNVNHVRIIGDGSNEMVEFRASGNPDTSEDTLIFSYTFTNVSAIIKGATFESTLNNDKLKMVVMSGGKYYDENHDWVSSPHYFELEFDAQGKLLTYDVAANGPTITLLFYTSGTTPAIAAFVAGTIKSITLETFMSDSLSRYTTSTDTHQTIIGDVNNDESANVDMLFQSAVGNDRKIFGGTASMPSYPYLLQAQQRQERSVKVKSGASVNLPLIYLYKMSMNGYSGYWRVIATYFDPVNDNYKMTMQSSPVLND